MTAPGDFKETLKQQADIVRIVGDYVRLKKAGAQNFSGLCPFHHEKSASFSVHATRQFYHCFGCGASGDVFSFVQKIENISFPEAVRLIAQKLGVPVPKLTYGTPEEARQAKHRSGLLDIHEAACEFFQQSLRRPEGAHAREYLKGRGLDQETVTRFRIGYAPDSGFLLRDYLRGKFEEDVLRESGLLSWKHEDSRPSRVPGRQQGMPPHPASGQAAEAQGNIRRSSHSSTSNDPRPTAVSAMYSKFRNRVMFPICNEHGKVIAFTGRTLATDEKSGPKYLNSPETPIYSKSRVLFNLDQAKEAVRKLDYAVLVEGQMDCISVFAAGFHNVIASSGTAFADPQAKLLGRFSKNVVVNFDPDTAGANATERTLGLLVEEDFQIKVLRLEAGLDPDLFIRQRGRDAYAQALAHSQRYFDYLIERARTQFPVRSAEGKVKAVNYLLPHIQRVPSRIVRDELALEISQKLGIESAVLRQELKHVAMNRSAAAIKAPAEVQVTDAERLLIRALASASQMTTGEGHVSGRDGVDDEFDPAAQAHFALRSEHLHHGMATESLIEALLNPGAHTVDVMQLPLSDADRRLLASILMKEDEELSPERLEGAVKALRRKHLVRRLQEIDLEIKTARSRDKDWRPLVEERARINFALRNSGVGEHSPALET